MKFFYTLALLMLVPLTGCMHSIDGKPYKEIEPTFSLTQFFDGKVHAWGIVQNRSGEVVQRFFVTIDGTYTDGVLTLDEHFEYGVGEGPEQRVWTITQNADGTFSGSASDIEGPARGIAYGNAFQFRYPMDLPVDNTRYRVNFDDWFWAFDDKTLMNRSYIKKFGLVMAEVTIFMQRQD